MSAWLINLAGILLIGLIIWWFWLSRPALQKAASDTIEIVVENGVYTPARIEIPANRALTLRFLRRDASPCAEKVEFDTLGISEDLPLGASREVRLPPLPAGEVEFTCQMKMYRGMLVVADAQPRR